MNRSSLRRTAAGGAALVALTIGLAACGDDSSDSSASDTTTSSAPASSPADSTSSDTASSSAATTDDAPFGPGCKDVPADGAGSFNGMVTDPVATAASNNPLLSTLVTAVGAVPGLGDTLNAAPALTVFAPSNDAFAKVPAATLKGLLADPATLGAVLSHHVIGMNLDPTAVVGTQTTLNKDSVTVTGDAESGMKVDGANVLCGGIHTKNATVYIIDSVLTPPAK